MSHPYAQYLSKHRFVPSIVSLPEKPPEMIVVIPSYMESDLLSSLESLFRCRQPSCCVEVIAVVNHPENASIDTKRQNVESLLKAQKWMQQHNDVKLQFHAIYKPDVPEKVAGVGNARKIGMDEAIYRFLQSGVENGVIISFDADATCDENYLEEIERVFFNGKTVTGASIYYEHPIEGSDYDADVYSGIILYELHLRYLIQALRYAGFPYSYHTVGSSFSVSASAYVKQGGMNRRKAGEDFHFLQKIIPLGKYVEINTTRVIPSARPSDRVPFGTGASISQTVNEGLASLLTYPLEPFEDLKRLFSLVTQFFKASCENIVKQCSSLPRPIRDYLLQNNYLTHIEQANSNSASQASFVKRFFVWFDALKTIQYLNESCRSSYNKQSPEKVAGRLLQSFGYQHIISAKELLHIYRKMERENNYLCTFK